MQTAEKTLSLAEIDVLLEKFRGKTGAGPAAEDFATYDLDTPSRIPKSALDAVMLRYEQAARMMQGELSTLLNNEVKIKLGSFEQMRFGALRDMLPEPALCFVVDLAPLREPGFLTIDYSLAFAAIDRLLGGPGAGEGDPRELTTTELAVLEDFVRPILLAHAFAWQPYTTIRPRVARAAFVARYVRDLRSEDIVMLARYRIGADETGPEIGFAVPLSGLEPHLQHEPRPVVAATNRAAIERDLAQNLSSVAVKMSVRVGMTRVNLRDVLNLRVGDVVVLDRQINEPCELLVEGQPKFAGYLGHFNGGFTWKMARSLEAKGRAAEKKT